MIDLALIPARGGSKRLPGKNLLALGGVPLIAWTIAAARSCGLFARIVVSTDDPAIAEAARAHGAETPFLRPADLSGDATTSDEMIAHALQAMATQGQFALLQPTSPFRSPAHIHAAADLYAAGGAAMVQSVTATKPLSWLMVMDDKGALAPADWRKSAANPVLPNGAIYLTDTAAFAAGTCLPRAGRAGLMMGTIDSLDIDTEEDFALAAAVVAAGLRGIAA